MPCLVTMLYFFLVRLSPKIVSKCILHVHIPTYIENMRNVIEI